MYVYHRAAHFQTLVWDLIIFVILQTFLVFFYICLKPRLFRTSHHKTTSKHPRIQEFWVYFAKNFFNSRQKQEKRPHSAGSFQTFFKHNVGNPGIPVSMTEYLFHKVSVSRFQFPFLIISIAKGYNSDSIYNKRLNYLLKYTYIRRLIRIILTAGRF